MTQSFQAAAVLNLWLIGLAKWLHTSQKSNLKCNSDSDSHQYSCHDVHMPTYDWITRQITSHETAWSSANRPVAESITEHMIHLNYHPIYKVSKWLCRLTISSERVSCIEIQSRIRFVLIWVLLKRCDSRWAGSIWTCDLWITLWSDLRIGHLWITLTALELN